MTAVPRYLAALSLALLVGCAAGPTSHVTTSRDGVTVAYERTGSGATTLVFVHGWSCDRTYWRAQIPAFAGDFTVLTVDLAGHGESGQGRDEYSIAAFAEDVAAAIRHADVEHVILIGHSMGGTVAVKTATLLPDRVDAVIGVDCLHELGYRMSRDDVERSLRRFETDFAAGVRSFVGGMFRPDTDPELAAWIRRDMAAAPPAVATSSMRSYLGLFTTDAAERLFGALTIPVRCLNAGIWPTRIAANRRILPSYAAKVLPDTGHFLMLEKPAEFNAELRRMIAELPRPHSDD